MGYGGFEPELRHARIREPPSRFVVLRCISGGCRLVGYCNQRHCEKPIRVSPGHASFSNFPGCHVRQRDRDRTITILPVGTPFRVSQARAGGGPNLLTYIIDRGVAIAADAARFIARDHFLPDAFLSTEPHRGQIGDSQSSTNASRQASGSGQEDGDDRGRRQYPRMHSACIICLNVPLAGEGAHRCETCKPDAWVMCKTCDQKIDVPQ